VESTGSFGGLGQGVKWGWIGINPAIAASPPRVLTAQINPPSPTQEVVASPSSFVFSDELDGATSWYPDSVSRRFRKLCEREAVTGVRLHDLRHFVATQLLSAGVDVRTLRDVLDIATPLRR